MSIEKQEITYSLNRNEEQTILGERTFIETMSIIEGLGGLVVGSLALKSGDTTTAVIALTAGAYLLPFGIGSKIKFRNK